jgi:hypothetical protein
MEQAVESYVGIMFWTVAGQIVHGDGLRTFLQPSFCTRRLSRIQDTLCDLSLSAPAALQTG